jgi:hypothetical protein
LDVDIGGLDIELDLMPNQFSIGIRLQYQSYCLDVGNTKFINVVVQSYSFRFKSFWNYKVY